MTRFALVTLGVCLVLGGCASLSKEECQVADWSQIGQRDGAEGRTPEFLARHVKACARVDVVPNQSLWERGRQSGLPLYCQPAKVYQQGRRGQSLSPVCPAADLPALEAANAKGRSYYRIGQEIDQIESELDDLGQDLVGEADEKARKALVRRMEWLRRDISRLSLERQRYAAL